jgi:hypothetical protein
MKFSDELLKKTIKYFDEECKYHINQETANEYLNSFADLYLIGTKLDQSLKKVQEPKLY